MSLWRPPPEIRVKVIGLAFRNDHLLAAEVLNRSGTLDGVRPLGGTVDFGETREDALRREFREELGADIDMLGDWTVYENIFAFEGETGHEIVFAAPIRVVDKALPIDEVCIFEESDGSTCRARWFPVADLIAGRPALYPNGLREALRDLASRHKA